ncbi:MAG: GNAT family N-acetyltransferase [Acidobacteriia bacterium]|nr:GNAT family N-acetyltransferase [Terriglobia bacterium]MBV8906539.1 GNAT family N-acetyltransferase [Terriglobia bacterium]
MFRLPVAPGIQLKLLETSEAKALYLLADRNRARLREWLPWVDQTRSPEDIKQFILRVLEQYHSNLGPQAGIWVDGVLCGAVGCHPIDWPNRNCSIGYWLDSAQEGKGVMTRCCASLADYAFDQLHLHRIEIRCATGNLRSCAVPQRLGFTREGVAREAEWVNDRWVDLVVWSMLDSDWPARKPTHEIR